MADVTVNIRGDASQLRGELENVSRITSIQSPVESGRTVVPPSERLLDEIRAEIQSQRVTNTKEAIETIRSQERAKIEESISASYTERRTQLQQRMAADYEAIEKDFEQRRISGIQTLGKHGEDPFYRNILEQQLEQQKELEYRRVGKKYDVEEQQLQQQQEEEITRANEELTLAIKELTDYFNRQSRQRIEESPDSYIGRLRAQQRSILMERGGAQTEEEVIGANKRLADINEQLRRALGGGESIQAKPYYDSMLQGFQGLMGTFGGLQRGDVGTTMMGVGGAVTGLTRMTPAAAMRLLGWIGLAAGAAKTLIGTSEQYESLGSLAAFRSPTGGYVGREAVRYLGDVIPDTNLSGVGVESFGYSTEQFGAEAARRIRARGMADDWFNETMRQIGLEKNFALTEGALMQGSRYDRYGVNVTDAITRLVSILSRIEDSGVSWNDFTRVQEKYDIQQQLMASYMGRSDRPSYDVANQMLAAFSSVRGITQDSRIGTDIQAFQSMIQNPINERMRALIYSSVSDLFPQAGGRMDIIDRLLRDPENEGKILQAVVQRITAQFGGPETQMGYFAFKTLLPGVAPERIDEYVKQIVSGEPADILRGGINQSAVNDLARQTKDILTVQATEFTTNWTKGKNEIVNKMNEIIGKMTGTTTAPQPNRPIPGGNK